MRHSEYERRQRALEQQYREDLELIRTAYQAKLHALETLWLASPAPARAADEPVPSEGRDLGREEAERPVPAEARATSETQAASETQGLSETQPPNETRETVRLPRGGLLNAIREVLPQLPEFFIKHDVVQALGFVPPRATLFRVLEELRDEKLIEIVKFSRGSTLTRYRKLADPE